MPSKILAFITPPDRNGSDLSDSNLVALCRRCSAEVRLGGITTLFRAWYERAGVRKPTHRAWALLEALARARGIAVKRPPAPTAVVAQAFTAHQSYARFCARLGIPPLSPSAWSVVTAAGATAASPSLFLRGAEKCIG